MALGSFYNLLQFAQAAPQVYPHMIAQANSPHPFGPPQTPGKILSRPPAGAGGVAIPGIMTATPPQVVAPPPVVAPSAPAPVAPPIARKPPEKKSESPKKPTGTRAVSSAKAGASSLPPPEGYSSWGQYVQEKQEEKRYDINAARRKEQKEEKDVKIDELYRDADYRMTLTSQLMQLESTIQAMSEDPDQDFNLIMVLVNEQRKIMDQLSGKTAQGRGDNTRLPPRAPDFAPAQPIPQARAAVTSQNPPLPSYPPAYQSMPSAPPVPAFQPPSTPPFQPTNASPVPPQTTGASPHVSQNLPFTSGLSMGYSPNMGATAANPFMS